jgi:hypothetical protein
MVHPCATSNPGTLLHACGSESSTTTLCGLSIQPAGINVTAGYTSVCKVCFPKDKASQDDLGDKIEGRQGNPEAKAEPTSEAL